MVILYYWSRKSAPYWDMPKIATSQKWPLVALEAYLLQFAHFKSTSPAAGRIPSSADRSAPITSNAEAKLVGGIRCSVVTFLDLSANEVLFTVSYAL